MLRDLLEIKNAKNCNKHENHQDEALFFSKSNIQPLINLMT